MVLHSFSRLYLSNKRVAKAELLRRQPQIPAKAHTDLRVQLKNTDIKVFELVAPAAKTPLNDKFAEEVDAKMLMEPEKLVAALIKGLENDRFEIYPGISSALKYLSRLAPQLLFNYFSKIAEKSLAKENI